jgi:2-(1,2-epoxy-1,2-dihydrophenyl)acetyl-CoA isomerase
MKLNRPFFLVGPRWCCSFGRFVSSDFHVQFTTAFINVGLSGDFGGTWTLPRIVGPAKARELYLTADVFKAEQVQNSIV